MQLFFSSGEYLYQLLYTIRLKNAAHVRIRVKLVDHTNRRLCFDLTPIECPFPYTIEVKCYFYGMDEFHEKANVNSSAQQSSDTPRSSRSNKAKRPVSDTDSSNTMGTLDAAFQRAKKKQKANDCQNQSNVNVDLQQLDQQSNDCTTSIDSFAIQTTTTKTKITAATVTATATATAMTQKDCGSSTMNEDTIENKAIEQQDPVHALFEQNDTTESYSFLLAPLLIQLEQSTERKKSSILLETNKSDEWVWMRALDRSFQVRVRKYESSDEASVCNPPRSPKMIQCFCPIGIPFLKGIVKTAYKQGAQWLRLHMEHVEHTRSAILLLKYRDDTVHAVDAEQRLNIFGPNIICRDESVIQAIRNGDDQSQNTQPSQEVSGSSHNTTQQQKRIIECSFVVHVPQLDNILQALSTSLVGEHKGGAYFALDRSQSYEVFLIYRRSIEMEDSGPATDNDLTLVSWLKKIDIQGHVQIQLPGHDCITI